MRVLGIDFVPINTPLRRHLEALAAFTAFTLLTGLAVIGIIFTVYLLFFTKYWYLACFYLLWIWVIDTDIIEKGGRPSEWVRSWTLFKYVRSYFPISIKMVPGFYLDPTKNYMSCTFPHGVMPIGAFAFLTNAFNDLKLYPKHTVRAVTLSSNFKIPLFRDFLVAIGMCSASPKSLLWLLNHPGGGIIAGIPVGGAEEALYSQPGQYRLILKNRKGFIKLALKSGCSIVPSFAFGQNDIFKQLVFPEGSFLRYAQEWLKRITGVALVIIYGRGFLQNTFGFVPLQVPISIVVGKPIDVQKVEQPTQEDIDRLHSEFIEKVVQLFEDHKYDYEKNPKTSCIVIS